VTERPVRPCLVYVAGLRGPEPQVWHDPMVTAAGKPAIAPDGVRVLSCHQLPPLVPGDSWSIGMATAWSRNQTAREEA